MNWTDKVSYWTSWHGSFSNRFRIHIQQVISKIKHTSSSIWVTAHLSENTDYSSLKRPNKMWYIYIYFPDSFFTWLSLDMCAESMITLWSTHLLGNQIHSCSRTQKMFSKRSLHPTQTKEATTSRRYTWSETTLKLTSEGHDRFCALSLRVEMVINTFHYSLFEDLNHWMWQAGSPWFSILTRTGVFKGKDNHPEFPADLVRIDIISYVAFRS